MHVYAHVRGPRVRGCVYNAEGGRWRGTNVREVQRDQGGWRCWWKEYSSEMFWIRNDEGARVQNKAEERASERILLWATSNESGAENLDKTGEGELSRGWDWCESSLLQSSASSDEQLAGPRGTLLFCWCTIALHDFRNVNSNRCANIYPRRHPHWRTSASVKGPRAQLWPRATIGFCTDRLICNVCACGISHTLGTECHTSCAAQGAWQGVVRMEWWVPACVPLRQSWWARTRSLCECGLPLKW